MASEPLIQRAKTLARRGLRAVQAEYRLLASHLESKFATLKEGLYRGCGLRGDAERMNGRSAHERGVFGEVAV
jgi:hypothetical protein